MATALSELLTRWEVGDGKPYKGQLIDWDAYKANPESISCFCAQGQVLHLLGGWSPERLRDTNQVEADKETAKMLNISVAHAILLRNVNDRIDGAPSIVLTDPGKVIGGEWSKLLDFWYHTDRMTPKQWSAARAAAGAAAGDAAGAAAWDAAGAAAWDAAGAAAGDAAGAAAWATCEIQGAHILRENGKGFYFLPLFGFADPDAIPSRPSNYGAQV